MTTYAASNDATKEKRPNIIFFFSDDQCYNSQKNFGNNQTKTPSLDKLASKGVVFKRHYNTTAICMASRANVMSGLYEYKSGCNFDHGNLATKLWTTSYPMLLKQNGYTVGFAGKFGFTVSDAEEMEVHREGEHVKGDFDFWAGGPKQTSYKTAENVSIAHYADKYPHSTRAYGAATIDFMKSAVKKDNPFCMSVFFKAPHKPSEPDPFFDDVYKDTHFDKLPNYGREAGEHLCQQSRMGRQYKKFTAWGYQDDEHYQQSLRVYHQLIYGVDYAIGMIMDELKNLEIDDNTIIIFSSDNGYFCGSHGLGGKVLPYEEGARVPLIVYDPRHPKSTHTRETTSITGNVDITATILDFAQVKIPSHYDGKSLLPIIDDHSTQVHKNIPITQAWGEVAAQSFSVVEQQYKYVYWFYKNEKMGIEPAEELFDIKGDPFEMKNIANDPAYKEVLANMRGLYDQQLQHWKNECVKNHGYPKYGVLYDRKLDWAQKEAYITAMTESKDDKKSTKKASKKASKEKKAANKGKK